MREIFSFIFDKVTDPLTLPIHPLWEWFILGVIGFIAYKVAYRKVGNLYRAEIISGRFAGSLCHWIIRFLIFVPIWAVVYWTIVFVQWIIANWVTAIVVLTTVIALIIAMTIVYKRIKNKRANTIKQ